MSILAPLFNFLECLARFAVGLLLSGLVGLVNLLVLGAGAALSLALSVLPTVDLGSASLPSSVVDSLGWANYFLPVDFAVQLILVCLGIEVAWFLVSWVLRFVKARG